MPSPIVPISRRIAWASEATFSLATVSGSARRSATWVIERADSRNSCSRRASAAKPKNKIIGPSAASASSTVSGLVRYWRTASAPPLHGKWMAT